MQAKCSTDKPNNKGVIYMSNFLVQCWEEIILLLHHNLKRQLFYLNVTPGLYYKSFTLVIYDHNDSLIVRPVL